MFYQHGDDGTMKMNSTIIMVILIGAGALLIISAIENSNLQTTFQSVLQGKPITSPPSGSGDPGATKDCPHGQTMYVVPGQPCPAGYKATFVGISATTCTCCNGQC